MNSLMLAMTTFAFVGAVTPGPVNILATSTAVTQGIREAIKHVVAASLAYSFVVVVCGAVMQSLLTLLPSLETVMQLIGSVFLLYLAYQIFTAPVSATERSAQLKSGWWTGSVTQLLNPKAWLYAPFWSEHLCRRPRKSSIVAGVLYLGLFAGVSGRYWRLGDHRTYFGQQA